MIVRVIIFNLVLMFSVNLSSAAHPVHVAVCNLEISDSLSSVAIKLYKDDFALVLKNNYQADVLMNREEVDKNREIISNYVNECLKIIVNKNKILRFEYEKNEITEDAIWLYFHSGDNSSGNIISIRNTLMMDFWDDQTNLLILNKNGFEQGYTFSRNELEVVVDLNHVN